MSNVVATWNLLKRLCGAAFLVPFGVLLVIAAVWIVRNGSGSWIAIGASAWLGYQGLNTIIGALANISSKGGAGGNRYTS
jgi:hypothetical protein